MYLIFRFILFKISKFKLNMKSDLTKLFLTGLFIVLVRTLSVANIVADSSYEIKIKLTDYTNDTLFLGYQLGNQTFIKDTALMDKASRSFVFKGTTRLTAGVYLLVMKPDNNYFQIMIPDNEQKFSIETNTQDPYVGAKLKGSKDNDVFFDYMKFLAVKRKEAEAANALKAKDSVNAVKKLEILDKEVKAYQDNLKSTHKGTVAAMLIKTATDIDVPKI